VFQTLVLAPWKARRLGARYDARVLLFAQADLLGRAESLAAHALGNLLDFATGLEESSNLAVATAGAGFALLLDAFTRMAATNL
jgi:hypothetical protein